MDRPEHSPIASDWPQIEAAARALVRAALEAEEAVVLEYGRTVAWAEYRFGRSDGLSVVHRVGVGPFDAPRALCGETIPAPANRLTLSTNMIRSLGRCRYCEEAYTQHGAVA